MAEQERTGGTRGSGLPSRAVGSWPERGAGSAVASGSVISTSRTIRATSPEPEFPTRDTATLATYRMLLMKGLSPEESANLTAFLCGIHVGDLHWKLIEVNRLLFLRRLARTGSWGASDGAPIKNSLTTAVASKQVPASRS
jgi:hypothetical protein